MKKYVFLFLPVFFFTGIFGQTYTPDWTSLDQRPVPQWYKDAKFGIFIHWGVYSVPGWSPKGTYAEWYQYGLEHNDTARIRFHHRKFGNLTYYQLADRFRAELFDPDAWAHLFEASGAKYIVLTSKHHDGFCLWPSQTADKTWGFPWNAAEVGPHRDLLGDLFKAVRKTSVRAGMYYSLYEWFNPLWKANRDEFVKEHTWPQMKELINTYQPDVFWTDGDWEAPAETWKSQEFLAWLYNESPVKDKVVVNDRWGAGIRFKHGGIYTPEYQPELEFENHYWEENRGMGFSYGYNREEDAWDYNSAQSLVLQLVDKVSRGGNFLLDVGPDAHGKIPPIMQERLLEIGDWLRINGESIYGTVRWKKVAQWSEGNRNYKPKNGSGDLLLKLTVDPDPGYAVKECFFTYNEMQNSLFAILPRYPSGHRFSLRDISLPPGTNIRLLSTNQVLRWSASGNNTIVDLPDYDPNKIKAPYAYVLKIEHFGRFAGKPKLSVEYTGKKQQPQLRIEVPPGAEVHFSMNDAAPDIHGPVYTGPIPLPGKGHIAVQAFQTDALPSDIVELNAARYAWQPGTTVRHPQKGLLWSAYDTKTQSVDALDAAKPVKTGTTDSISLAPAPQEENFGLRFDGYIRISRGDRYEFFLSSDDGSALWIDGQKVIDNDGLHGNNEISGTVALRKGFHQIRLDYFQATGGRDLQLKYRKGSGTRVPVGAQMFYH